MSIKSSTSPDRILTRAEQEVQSGAERLTAQMNDALAAVAVRSANGQDELEAVAERLERAARDLAVALRELANERGKQDAR